VQVLAHKAKAVVALLWSCMAWALLSAMKRRVQNNLPTPFVWNCTGTAAGREDGGCRDTFLAVRGRWQDRAACHAPSAVLIMMVARRLSVFVRLQTGPR